MMQVQTKLIIAVLSAAVIAGPAVAALSIQNWA